MSVPFSRLARGPWRMVTPDRKFTDHDFYSLEDLRDSWWAWNRHLPAEESWRLGYKGPMRVQLWEYAVSVPLAILIKTDPSFPRPVLAKEGTLFYDAVADEIFIYFEDAWLELGLFHVETYNEDYDEIRPLLPYFNPYEIQEEP